MATGSRGKKCSFSCGTCLALTTKQCKDYYIRIKRCPTSFKEQVLRKAHLCPFTGHCHCCYVGEMSAEKQEKKTFQIKLYRTATRKPPSSTQLVASEISARLSELQRDDASVQALPQTPVRNPGRNEGLGPEGWKVPTKM